MSDTLTENHEPERKVWGGGAVPLPRPVYTDPDTGDKYYFPENTRIADMTAEQESEYWRHKSRKHEGRVKSMSDYDDIKAERDRLKAEAAKLGPSEDGRQPEVDADKIRGDVVREERAKYNARLLDAEFKAAARDLPAEIATTLGANLRVDNFLDTDGAIDSDKVAEFVAKLRPTNSSGQSFDMGQGRREQVKAGKADAGLAEAEKRFGKPNQ